ncbi:protein-L-isoaspartate O-methyltransferase family protein [Shimazuella kribbensis]|uniref:protein-L-isoaspartate O-methyltransferase family protein n=1 Tax=Shimazuella kribbensis TaxID=139808 RepID=UPI0003F75999|nr:methyltransferase domain-containing protein [Shimazuella kribbensis]
MDIKQVINQVNRDDYVWKEDGDLLPQTTATEAIENGLRMLQVQKGQRVLEIGTGSGYSTALLANLVGTSGQVVSVDIDPELTKRANGRLSNYPHVTCVTRDGRTGYELNAPYDRIIAWTTPEYIPNSWKDQLKEDGIIVAPFRVLPIAGCMVTVQLKNVDGKLQGGLVSQEGYIMMTSEPVVNFFGHEIHADVTGTGDHPFWASSEWMKQLHSENWNKKFVQASPESSSFEESGMDIRPYLLGKYPDGFTFAFHPDHGYLIGYSSPEGFALLSYHYENKWMVSDKKHEDVLSSWWNDWVSNGKPSYDQLKPIVVGDRITVTLRGGE